MTSETDEKRSDDAQHASPTIAGVSERRSPRGPTSQQLSLLSLSA